MRCSMGLSRNWPDTWPMIVSPSSIRPKPIRMRPPPRMWSFSEALNSTTPMNSRAAQIHLISMEYTWATSAVPTSAPSMMASARGNVTSLRLANEASSSAVAVALCSKPVTPTPTANALARLEQALPSSERSEAPKARVMPVRTMRTLQRSSATPPISVTRSSLPSILRSGCRWSRTPAAAAYHHYIRLI